MATQSNLTKINVFPSLEDYNSNRTEIKASEIAIVPDDTTLEKKVNLGNKLTNASMYYGEDGRVNYRELVQLKTVVTNATELQQAQGKGDAIKEVFDTYTPYELNSSTGVASASLTEYAGMWSYNQSTQNIECAVNANPWGIYLSPETFENYSITIYATAIAGDRDDDALTFTIAGYVEPSTNKFINLTLVRSNGGLKPTYALVLNARRPVTASTDVILWDGSTIVSQPAGSGWTAYPQRLEITRQGSTISFRTSMNKNGSSTGADLVDSTKYTYTLPSSKPSNLTDVQWQNLQTLLNTPQQIAYGCCSNRAAFKIESQRGILPDTNIYDISTGTKYVLNTSNKYVASGKFTKDDILPNSLIYSPTNKHLIYFDRDLKHYQIK